MGTNSTEELKKKEAEKKEAEQKEAEQQARMNAPNEVKE